MSFSLVAPPLPVVSASASWKRYWRRSQRKWGGGPAELDTPRVEKTMGAGPLSAPSFSLEVSAFYLTVELGPKNWLFQSCPLPSK